MDSSTLTHRQNLPRRMIIEKYKEVRMLPLREHSVIYEVAIRLGYAIDKNRTNDYVRRVIREYLSTRYSHSSVKNTSEQNTFPS
jgi:hypothetical protein